MKAPDKIYLHGYEFSVRPVNSWSEKMTDGLKGHNAINVEYVRKDLVEHIIRGALGPQDALNKIRSL